MTASPALTLDLNTPQSESKVVRKEGLLPDFLSTCWYYREYLKQSVARDLRKRYKRSVLGYFWSMLQPLLMMTILAVVFSNMMRSTIQSYAVYLFSGMVAWKYFSSTITESLNSLSSNIKLIHQLPLPKYLFPLAHGFSNLVDFFLTLAPLFLVILVVGHPLHISLVALPFLFIPLFCFSVAAAMLFSVSNVFFNDTQHLTGVLLQALYFLCPIIYTRDHLPQWLVPYLMANPMFGIIEMMHAVLYYGQFPSWEKYCAITAASVIALMAALWVFRKADNKFIYFI